MPSLEYRGFDARGKPVTGVRDADGARGLRVLLKKQGVFVTEVREAGEGSTSAGAKGRGKGLRREMDLKSLFDRVRPQDIAMLTRQLGTLLKAGIPLVEALAALMEQASSAKLARSLAEVRTKVNEGTSLGDALSEHPQFFSALYVNMVRAGEAAGNLEQVVLRLADFMDGQVKLRGKVLSAMMYPTVTGIIAVAITGLLMAVVVPKVTMIFDDIQQALPWYTELLVSVSWFIEHFWPLILGVGSGGWWLFGRWRRSPKGKPQWDGFVLRLFLVGTLVRMVAISRFARTLGTMLASGVPLLRALEIVKSILGNHVLMGVVDEARLAIREGESIADPLARSGQFPPVVTRMIAVGERSGALESMLENVADAYEGEVDMRLGQLTMALEPIMIVLMATMVGFIVFAILKPILMMNEMVG